METSRKIVKLEPNNYQHLSDLGYSLIQTGEFKEAEVILKKAIELAPDDYILAKGNLEHLIELRKKIKETGANPQQYPVINDW